MTLTRNVNGQTVVLSAQEEAALLVEWAANALKVPPIQPVTALQARRALRAAGLYDTVLATVNAATDPDVLDSWQYAALWHRDARWIITLSAQLNMTSAQVDALFIQAATLGN